MTNKLEVKIMTKYLVKIYNCGKLEDARILEETDKIELADYYIQDNQLWGEVWAETDDDELYYEKVIICLKVKAELGLNEETVADVIKGYEDETTFEDYLGLDLIDFEVTQVNGYAVEDVLTPAQIQAVEKSIAESIELDYMNDEAGVKILIQEYERSRRRGIPKEIASQYSEETIKRVKDTIRKSDLRYADLSDIQLQLALELASRNLDFEGCLYLRELDEKSSATVLEAAKLGYILLNDESQARYLSNYALMKIRLASAALETDHLEILDRIDRTDYDYQATMINMIENNEYDPIFLDPRVLDCDIKLHDIRAFIQSGAGIERVKEILEDSSSVTEFRAYMICEELLASDRVNGKKIIDHLKKSSNLEALANDTWKYRAILELMKNDSLDADELLVLSDKFKGSQASKIMLMYRNSHDLFNYVSYAKAGTLSEDELESISELFEYQKLKALELYRDNSDYDWIASEDYLRYAVSYGNYEDFILDESLSSEESRELARIAAYRGKDALMKAKELFDNRENLDKGFIESLRDLYNQSN